MCGVFGVHGHEEAAKITYLGLHALQHRGQESAGIVASNGERLASLRKMGLVQSGFSSTDLVELAGSLSMGHVRYSTAGGSHLRNAQPFAVDYQGGSVAVAHNGNLTNHEALRRELEAGGSIFQSGSDTEVIVHLIARSRASSLEGRVVDALSRIDGAYSLLVMDEERLVAVRDPRGLRPLCLGVLRPRPAEARVDASPAYVVASESVAFELIGADLLRELDPGEMLVIDARGLTSSRPLPASAQRSCIFEHVYFARPDSVLEGASVYEVRKRLGRRVIEEHPVPGASSSDTVVIPVPDSGLPAAIGLAHHAGLPFEMGLIRSHYVGRTFIEPSQSIRHLGVKLKLSPNRGALDGKRVIVVDDSIVRGTTSRKLVGMLRSAGAREVHVRISSPPTTWPCFYGIDTPTRSELIAASHDVEEIRRYLQADSLGYLSLDGLLEAVREASGGKGRGSEDGGDRHCHACFSGVYPVPIAEAASSARHLRVLGE
ncbi:MAG: amidophosphoribosyltransferase [Deltaproteobacteria bacterium]|nr:amidophosphoribosyltransferase [Deltaproteobacteria bacterium]